MSPYREPPAPERRCPRCGGGLSARSIADATVEECARCGGVFVASGLVPRVVDALDLGGEVISTFPPRAPQWPSTTTYLRCPRCATVMNRRLFATGAKVVVDICAQHGIWFDDAELRAVAVFAAGGGMERAAARDAAERARRERDAHRTTSAARQELTQVPELDERTSLLGTLWELLRFF
jgi:Zn-finger nucleic acid-binding protein